MEFARENPNFYKLMWSPGVAANSTAFRDAYQILRERMELCEAVIDSVSVPPSAPTSKRRVRDENGPTLATAAATLKSKVAAEDTPLTQPEQALLQQCLTALADTPLLQSSTSKR